MTFTYDPTQLASKPYMQVRLALGDVDPNAAEFRRLEDEEIAFRLTQYTSVDHAAVICGEDLIAKWAHREVGTVSGSQQQRYDWLCRRVAGLRARLVTLAAPVNTAGSAAEKEQARLDTDRVPPAFAREMFDNPEARPGSPEPSDDETA